MKAICKLVAALAIGVATLAGPGAAQARPVGGTVQRIEVVPARATDSYTVNLVAGQAVMVMAIGDGDTDLDLFVYDADGVLVGSDTDLTDTCLVRFTPRAGGAYTIKVKNLGAVGNRYALIVK